MNKNQSDNIYNEKLFPLLPASVFICYLTVGLPLPVISMFVHHDLGLNSTLVGLGVGIQFLATVTTRGYAGKSADTKGAKRTAMTGLFACGGAGLFYLGASLLQLPTLGAYGILLLGRLLLGFGESMLLTGVLAWGFGLLGPSRTGLVMAWNGMAIFGALAAGAPIGLELYNRWGFEALGISTLALPLLALALNAGIPATPPHKGARAPFKTVAHAIWKPGLGLFLQGVGFAVIGTFSSLYFKENGWGNAGMALSAFGGAFVLLRIVGGKLPDKVKGISVILFSFMAETAGLFLLWMAPGQYTALAGAALAGAGTSLLFPALGVVVVNQAPPQSRGTAIGWFAAFQDISYAVSGPVTGALATGFGLSSVFLVAAISAAAGTLLTLTLRTKA